MPPITKILVAALVTFGTVSARPQQEQQEVEAYSSAVPSVAIPFGNPSSKFSFGSYSSTSAPVGAGATPTEGLPEATPSGDESEPTPTYGESEPTPTDIEPTPTGGESEPTPTGGESEPTPTGGESEPTPTYGETEPTPTDIEPTPTGGETEPTPTYGETEPTPTDVEPTPTGGETEPTPTYGGTEPTPTDVDPTPTDVEPTPTDGVPTPTDGVPTPTEGEPTPTDGVPTPSATPIAAPETNSQLVSLLRNAASAIKRFQLLLTVKGKGKTLLEAEELRKRTVFSFNDAQPSAMAKGGATKTANIETFPILTGLGLSTTVGFLKACGMNTPHVHPRASEFLTVVSGAVNFGYILENGLVPIGENAEIAGRLETFEGTIFPMGSIHYQFNPECEEAVFVATLDNEDPGTSQMAQNLFGLNEAVVNATLGWPNSVDGKDIASFRKQIPANVALAIDSCLKQCGI